MHTRLIDSTDLHAGIFRIIQVQLAEAMNDVMIIKLVQSNKKDLLKPYNGSDSDAITD